MSRHPIPSLTHILVYDVVDMITDHLDRQTHISFSQVNKEWYSLLRRRFLGPHLRVTVSQFSKLLITISASPPLFNDVLQSTKCLTIVDSHGASNMDNIIDLFTPYVIKAFSKIHSLELDGSMNFTSFTAFLVFFPALDTLIISGVQWRENPSTMDPTRPIHRYDKGLRMYMDLSWKQITTMLGWLLANNVAVHVMALKIDITLMRDNDRLILPRTSVDELRTLQLSNINPLMNITGNALIFFLHDQFISTTLENLTLTVFAYNKIHLERLPWGTICIILADRLECGGLKQLEVVVLDIESPNLQDGLEQFLRGELAPFSEKDILTVKFQDSG
ncbi:hypothetical protein BDQ12DRAFT_688282 [Crucibulum laeve]|uniref:F-box domain-containing protein n=1 Tax=Crucibulum laeve TaxID=68775 RepID=A0A5C3LRK8_9AGAR|nr:hypothetical protein BDQ12DRAFT_688282 [Crucibulum laeve]